jgi:hypothetical protein
MAHALLLKLDRVLTGRGRDDRPQNVYTDAMRFDDRQAEKYNHYTYGYRDLCTTRALDINSTIEILSREYPESMKHYQRKRIKGMIKWLNNTFRSNAQDREAYVYALFAVNEFIDPRHIHPAGLVRLRSKTAKSLASRKSLVEMEHLSMEDSLYCPPKCCHC